MLEARDRPAERLALLDVALRLLQQVLGRGGGADGDGQPLLRQVGHQMAERAVQLTEQVLLGHADVVEEQLGGVLRLLADLGEVAPALEALGAPLDDEQAQPLGPALRGGPGDDDHQVGEDAVGDERLGTVDHPVVALVDGGRPDALEVGARARLGHGDGGDRLAAAEAGQPAPLLLLGGQGRQVRADDVVVQGDGEAGGPGPGELLGQDGAVAEVGGAPAAVLLGRGEAEQALPPGGPPRLARDDAVVLPLLAVRDELPLQERPHGGAEGFVPLVEELTFHDR
ncbi:hypothetical protein GCM10020221_19920 [Streptomyces thioluteus]|uniref:Uncharacterized protein n=1 Tax=Streptomyces thioluteus TaxID=66431 RepID=A0ABN3WQ44_STRTU